jgi:hypothetical protein
VRTYGVVEGVLVCDRLQWLPCLTIQPLLTIQPRVGNNHVRMKSGATGIPSPNRTAPFQRQLSRAWSWCVAKIWLSRQPIRTTFSFRYHCPQQFDTKPRCYGFLLLQMPDCEAIARSDEVFLLLPASSSSYSPSQWEQLVLLVPITKVLRA